MNTIGFTGTRHGMTSAQRHAVGCWLRQLYLASDSYFLHGDCLGADAEAHDLAREIGYVIYKHPGNKASWRANKQADHEHEPREPLLRNRIIVNSVNIMLAAPREPVEVLRSGTWHTIRYTRELHKPLVLVLPDGTYQQERLAP